MFLKIRKKTVFVPLMIMFSVTRLIAETVPVGETKYTDLNQVRKFGEVQEGINGNIWANPKSNSPTILHFSSPNEKKKLCL